MSQLRQFLFQPFADEPRLHSDGEQAGLPAIVALATLPTIEGEPEAAAQTKTTADAKPSGTDAVFQDLTDTATEAPEDTALEPLHIPTLITQEMLEEQQQAAYKKGVDEGYEKGLAEGRGERLQIDQALILLLDSLATRLVSTEESILQSANTQRAEAMMLSRLVAEKLSAEALHRMPQAPLQALLEQCADLLKQEKRIVITVHDSLKPLLEEQLQTILAEKNLRLEVSLLSTPNLAPGDCHIAWEYGGAEFSQAAITAQIDALFDSFLSTR